MLKNYTYIRPNLWLKSKHAHTTMEVKLRGVKVGLPNKEMLVNKTQTEWMLELIKLFKLQ
jgi:hypothetical protein